MKKIFLLILLIPSLANATTYWVSPTGAAAYTACTGATPLSGSAACGLSEMGNINSHVAAGDTVYFRDGAYTSSGGASLIVPGASGSSGSRITYSAYTGEAPVITNTNSGTAFYPVYINTKSYVTINGLTFVDYPRGMHIQNDSHYNIISYCELYRNSAVPSGGVGRGIQITSNTVGSTHNWIHHNTIHDLWSSPCGEGGDGIIIGDTGTNYDSNYNTIENNTIYHMGHTGTENFTQYNVFRNNYSYNNGFKTFTANLTGTATGGGATSLIDTSKNFTDLGVMAGSFIYVHDLSSPGSGNAYRAQITSISTTTNVNDTVNYSSGTGTPTFSAGHSYSIGCAYFADSNPPGDGKYAHRTFHLDSHSGQRVEAYNDRILFEGNRGGHAASNPGNDAADGLSLSAAYSIVRYNSFFGNAGPGLYTKNGIVCSYNKIYNNTIFNNGLFAGVQYPSNPITLSGVQVNASSTYNVFKNNIIYNNADGAFDFAPPANWTLTNNWCPTAGSGDCVGSNADPLFTDTTMTSYSSTTLPNLALQSSSGAINAGVALTTASGSGSGSTSLTVADAGYFQDGTWGSDLTRTAGTMQADWIAIGTVDNVVQISSINYATNTITLANAVSWSDNDPVWLFKKSDGTQVLYGSAPDIGAYEYEEAAPAVTVPLTGGVLTGGTISR